MTVWLALGGAFLAGVAAANAVTVRRYSARHVVGEVALRGRGLFFSRTPDGMWWKLQLRPRRCNSTYPDGWGDAPAGGGVREPRRPPGPDPLRATVKLRPPGC